MQSNQIITWNDSPYSAARGWLVLDAIINGVAGGGVFLHENCSLKEVRDLANDMTFKNILNPTPFGGAKAGIQYSHNAADANDVLERFLVFCHPYLKKCWATGSDLNTTHVVIDSIIQNKLRLNSSLSALSGMYADKLGVPDQAFIVNKLLMQAVNETFDLVTSATGYLLASLISYLANQEPITMIIHGFGNVGSSLAFYAQYYFNIRVIGISDITGCLVNEGGIDIIQLIQLKKSSPDFTLKDLIKSYKIPGKWVENNFLNQYHFLSFYLKSVYTDCVSLCADRYCIDEDVLSMLVKHTVSKSNKKMLLCGANRVFSKDELIFTALNAKINYLPTWVTSSGTSLLFGKLLSSVEYRHPKEVLSELSDDLIRQLISAQEKYGKNLHDALYQQARKKLEMFQE